MTDSTSRLPAAALQFPLAHPRVSTVLIGFRSVAELDDDLRWLDTPIPGELWDELRREADSFARTHRVPTEPVGSRRALMRIDAHHHFWDPAKYDYPWMEGDALDPIRRAYGPEDLAVELARADIDGTVLVQTVSSESETREFLRVAEATDFVLGVVGWVDLTAEDVGERLDALRERARAAAGWSGSAIRSTTRLTRGGYAAPTSAAGCWPSTNAG